LQQIAVSYRTKQKSEKALSYKKAAPFLFFRERSQSMKHDVTTEEKTGVGESAPPAKHSLPLPKCCWWHSYASMTEKGEISQQSKGRVNFELIAFGKTVVEENQVGFDIRIHSKS